jgi:hypothetical protein
LDDGHRLEAGRGVSAVVHSALNVRKRFGPFFVGVAGDEETGR